MASTLDIAKALNAGMAPPTGDSDVALHQGVIRTWDRQTGVNTVEVSGTVLTNLDSLQGGLPNTYNPGDVVLLARKQSRYFIMGKVASATGLAGSAPANSANNVGVHFTASSGWVSLPSPAVSPSVTTYIGSSRRAIVLWQANVDARDARCEVGWEISGASSVAPGAFAGMSSQSGTWRSLDEPDIITYGTASGNFMATPGIGLLPGLNTFTMKFKPETYSAAGSAYVGNPGITVIPM